MFSKQKQEYKKANPLIPIYNKTSDDWIKNATDAGMFLISYQDLPINLPSKMGKLMNEAKKLYLNKTSKEIKSMCFGKCSFSDTKDEQIKRMFILQDPKLEGHPLPKLLMDEVYTEMRKFQLSLIHRIFKVIGIKPPEGISAKSMGVHGYLANDNLSDIALKSHIDAGILTLVQSTRSGLKAIVNGEVVDGWREGYISANFGGVAAIYSGRVIKPSIHWVVPVHTDKFTIVYPYDNDTNVPLLTYDSITSNFVKYSDGQKYFDAFFALFDEYVVDDKKSLQLFLDSIYRHTLK
uniref:2OG-Fe(II) oxygenase superfamily protein n=1 Tax=Pithovirus LCPAC101 TaxID=2506586 RepID=A0A481Z306_9VIRU|nr:MAG: hypothetical protein LCPAC101_01070 [Pithovirus LCPAC101]